MDVIIEGQINQEEGMSDLIQAVLDIKSVPNPVVRINSTQHSDLQGRVVFTQGGYILGARVTGSNAIGYEALRALFSVTEGNYAILDPGKQALQDVNQTLWIRADKIASMLPNLPESPEAFLDEHPEGMANLVSRPMTAAPLESARVSRTDLPRMEPVKKEIGSQTAKSRAYDGSAAARVQALMFLVVAALIVGVVWYFRGALSSYLPSQKSAPQSQTSTQK